MNRAKVLCLFGEFVTSQNRHFSPRPTNHAAQTALTQRMDRMMDRLWILVFLGMASIIHRLRTSDEGNNRPCRCTATKQLKTGHVHSRSR